MADPYLLILTGPPGAGKSTVGRAVAVASDPSVSLESDWMWTTVVRGHVPPWEPAADAQNRAMLRASLAAASRMCAAGYATVLEGIIGPWHWDLVLDEVGPVLERVSYVVLRPGLEVCLERAAGRADRDPDRPALRDTAPIRHLWDQFRDLGPFERYAVDTTGLDTPDTVSAVEEALASGSHRVTAGT